MTQDVTFLGIDEMGAALATTALSAGYRTTAWNRSTSRVAALRKRGATVADTAADAIDSTDLGAELVDAVQRLIQRQIDAGHGADGFARVIESIRHPREAA